MGRLFLMHLDGNVYSCKHCDTHLGLASDIISKVCSFARALCKSLFTTVFIIRCHDVKATCFRFLAGLPFQAREGLSLQQGVSGLLFARRELCAK